jgi:hypothetical protein
VSLYLFGVTAQLRFRCFHIKVWLKDTGSRESGLIPYFRIELFSILQTPILLFSPSLINRLDILHLSCIVTLMATPEEEIRDLKI